MRPSTQDSPRASSRHAEAGEEEILLAHALQAGDAEDLALRRSKLTPSSLRAGREIAHAEHRRAERLRAVGLAAERSARCERPMIISITSASVIVGDRRR